jgi:chromosome segregation ATPase
VRLKELEIVGFKSFAKKATLEYSAPISAIVGPNGSGKSNVAEAMRFVLGEQSIKSMRGKKGEDLIFNGTEKVGRLNHAKVTVVFNNSDRAFKIDFDEVSIGREVFRDGTHQYYINGSQVRLKDVLELLSSVHIGASSHHIISQGEADRILNASPKERKGMIEDALGLKIYHWRIDESEKKLIKTEANLKEVDVLRREIAPHLKYLKKQVEKIEKAQSMRDELAEKYREYLKREDIYLKTASAQTTDREKKLVHEQEQLEAEIAKLSLLIKESDHTDPREQDVSRMEQELASLRSKRSELMREMGKIEGMIEYERRRKAEYERSLQNRSTSLHASMDDVEALISSLEKVVSVGDGAQFDELRSVLEHVQHSLRDFRERHTAQDGAVIESTFDAQAEQEFIANKDALQKSIQELSVAEEALVVRISSLRKDIEDSKTHIHEAQRELYERKAQQAQHAAQLESVRSDIQRLDRELNDFEEEVREGVSLIGAKVKEFHTFEVGVDIVMQESRHVQEDRRRAIERIKLRIEDLGGGSGEDVMKEYKDVEERDAFLAKEVTDLTESASSLRGLIEDLNEQLDKEFQTGVTKINEQFQNFFALMFGGGTAALSLVAEVKRKKMDVEDMLSDTVEDAPEEMGIDITVSLPRKKIRGLQMLSGGERALTSIALLFAVSQVNPPPFMILDETDAALDEANSRKYGDMLENLSKFSQLIVITHNRETMSRAGILYGVTMDADATSKLLSVKFEEAAEIAK